MYVYMYMSIYVYTCICIYTYLCTDLYLFYENAVRLCVCPAKNTYATKPMYAKFSGAYVCHISFASCSIAVSFVLLLT
jgi:hypothetical protein